MVVFPKIQKEFCHLSQTERLRDKTLKLVTRAFMSAGLVLGAGIGIVDAQTSPVPSISIPAAGKVIVLAPPFTTAKGQMKSLGQHYSHSSHSSHYSHQSHYSSRY